MFTEKITILRAGTRKDRYGNVVPDGTVEELAVPFRVAVQPANQAEGVGGREVTLMTGWRLFTPEGRDLDLRATDQVRWQGQVLEVVGEVARWPGFTGGVDHVEADLQRIES